MQAAANLFVIAGHVNIEDSTDDEERHQIDEERHQIKVMYDLLSHYQLGEKVRWVGKHLDKRLIGKLFHKALFNEFKTVTIGNSMPNG